MPCLSGTEPLPWANRLSAICLSSTETFLPSKQFRDLNWKMINSWLCSRLAIGLPSMEKSLKSCRGLSFVTSMCYWMISKIQSCVIHLVNKLFTARHFWRMRTEKASEASIHTEGSSWSTEGRINSQCNLACVGDGKP